MKREKFDAEYLFECHDDEDLGIVDLDAETITIDQLVAQISDQLVVTGADADEADLKNYLMSRLFERRLINRALGK